jgi:hypothetical protein
MTPSPGPTASHATIPGSTAIPREELVRQYEGYRVRQARALMSLMPRDAVRPLYRRARDASSPDGVIDDPMSLLVDFCEGLLPLPPFEVWLEDLRRNPGAHWQDLDGSADAPTATAPATIVTRRFRPAGRPWRAHLRGFRDGDAWRGFIAFESADRPGQDVHRTALIFREATVEELRDRFRAFESASLEAFLRSALP